MGKNNAAAAHRAKKKHEKDLKRKNVAARKRPETTASAAVFMPPGRATDWLPVVEGIEGLAARLLLPFYEAAYLPSSPFFEGADRPPLPDAVWTRAKVVALETSDIVARLEELGVTIDREAFIAGTPRFGSAAQVARDAWFPLLPATADVHARDFSTLAACELWRRWRPEVPSQEMLLELVLLGEDSLYRRDGPTAIEHWIGFWGMLQPLLTPEMRRPEDVDELLDGGDGLFFDWVSDFSTVATGVARPDAALGRRVAEVQAAILAQFSEESKSWRLKLILDHAEMLYAVGERVEAERILHEQIDKHPTNIAAYVTLSELWVPFGSRGRADRASVARALALLEQAAARGVKHTRGWNLKLRIKDMRALLRAVDENARKDVAPL